MTSLNTSFLPALNAKMQLELPKQALPVDLQNLTPCLLSLEEGNWKLDSKDEMHFQDWHKLEIEVDAYDQVGFSPDALRIFKMRWQVGEENPYQSAKLKVNLKETKIGLRLVDYKTERILEVILPHEPSFYLESTDLYDPFFSESVQKKAAERKFPLDIGLDWSPVMDNGHSKRKYLILWPDRESSDGTNEIVLSFLRNLPSGSQVQLLVKEYISIDKLKELLKRQKIDPKSYEIKRINPDFNAFWLRDYCIPVLSPGRKSNESRFPAIGFLYKEGRESHCRGYNQAVNGRSDLTNGAVLGNLSLDGGNMWVGDRILFVGKNSAPTADKAEAIRKIFQVDEVVVVGTERLISKETLNHSGFPAPLSYLTTGPRYQPLVHLDLFFSYLGIHQGKHLIALAEYKPEYEIIQPGLPGDSQEKKKARRNIGKVLDAIGLQLGGRADFKVFRVPFCWLIYNRGGSHWATYNNLLADLNPKTNEKRLLLPFYSHPNTEMNHLLSHFNGKTADIFIENTGAEIVPIGNALLVARDRGAIRCLTSLWYSNQ
ncbi:MAG: hypothetical protein H6581_04185 [Bacteroidia bacterium]|nr:hypothetical protein [Bacteroidia bacterium]